MKSIKTKGIIFSLSVILIVTTTLGISSYMRFKHLLVDEVNNTVERTAEESASHLAIYIDQLITPLIDISQNDQITSMNWEKQREVLSNQIDSNYQNVAVIDSEGMAHYIDETTLDLSDRDYIKEALKGEVVFSEVIISRKTNAPSIIIAVPINRGNMVVGALIARLDVDFLSNFTLSCGYGKNDRVYIISDIGTLISSPEQERTEDNYNLFELAEKEASYNSFSEFVDSNKNNESGYGSYKLEDQKMLTGYSSIEKTNWKIYISTSEEEAMDSLQELAKILAVVIIATLIFSSIAAWIFVNEFTNPIADLDHLFYLGAQGDLSIRFTPKSKDEIGRLGVNFNRMMDKIKTLTQYDPLTSLLNQYVLEKDVNDFVYNDEIEKFSLIMIAIDKFSFINETYGYTIGDIVLCDVAKRILNCVNEDYELYRYKGDEFVVLGNENITDNDVDEMAQNILTILKENYNISGKMININVSMGTFVWKADTDEEDPLKAVTQAKNYAKYLGGSQLQKFNQEIYKKLMIMKEMQADIINGLKEDQFFMVYQPLINLKTGKTAEIEALIRWRHPEKGLLYPDQFIDLAEQAGTIINIDYWVLEKACQLLQSWKNDKKAPILLSINISAKTFETKRFIPDLLEMIDSNGIDPTFLQLEITERMVIQNVEESIYKLNELRAMGIHIAIDDFGIGYSSLSYIVRLPIDSIKIDKAFIQNITDSKEAKAIVSTIINLCKTLNLNVIAEGIENSIELDYLTNNQCDIGQGYYFSRPVSIVEIDKYL